MNWKMSAAVGAADLLSDEGPVLGRPIDADDADRNWRARTSLLSEFSDLFLQIVNIAVNLAQHPSREDFNLAPDFCCRRASESYFIFRHDSWHYGRQKLPKSSVSTAKRSPCENFIPRINAVCLFLNATYESRSRAPALGDDEEILK